MKPWAVIGWLAVGSTAFGCPFCGVVEPSLAARRDAADVVAAGESAGLATTDAAGRTRQPFTPHAVIRGTPPTGGPVQARVPAAVEGSAVLFGRRADSGLEWEASVADETVIAHVAEAPPVTEPAADRLRWFLPRLDHPSATIADDAFAEFGTAPFEAVRDVADAFDADALIAHLANPAGDQRRRGFYGLALGLAAVASDDPARRERCHAALRAAVKEPADDRRAGFDGILGGVLVAEGPAGLVWLRDRGLFTADTRPGDARHALAAARFAWESLGDSLPRDDVAAAVARLLDNPAVAAECIVDLSRYRRWDDLSRVAALWHSRGRDDPLIRRAVAGYLVACPLPAARDRRTRLAADDPAGWQAAEAAARMGGEP